MRPTLPALLLFLSCLPRSPVHPKCAEYNDRCVVALANGAAEEAKVLCDHSLEWCPEYPDAWNNLGLVEERLGHDALAKEAFLKAIRLAPDHHQAHHNMGRLLMKERQFARAAQEFERALDVVPDYRDSLEALGVAQVNLGQLDRAEAQFHKLTLVHPDYAYGHYVYCAFLAQQSRPADAAPSCERAQLIDPSLVPALQLLGALLVDLGRLEEAATYFRLCLDRDPSNSQCQESLERINQNLRLEPTSHPQ